VRYTIVNLAGNVVGINHASSEVAQDETTEQVFSRKTDRKAYRAEVLGKRTAEAKRTVTERQASPLGEEKQTRSKAKH
jgi:hypothetical protein